MGRGHSLEQIWGCHWSSRQMLATVQLTKIPSMIVRFLLEWSRLVSYKCLLAVDKTLSADSTPETVKHHVRFEPGMSTTSGIVAIKVKAQ